MYAIATVHQVVEKIKELGLFFVKDVDAYRDPEVDGLVVIRIQLSRWGYLFMGLLHWWVDKKVSSLSFELPIDVEVSIQFTYKNL